MKFQSFLAIAITILAFFTESCQNPAPAPQQQQPASDASSILSHRYWVSKPFHDALFNANVADTLGNISCSELIFASKDTVIFTSCLSDAGIGIVKSTGANTLEIIMDGFDNQPSKFEYNPATGILHFTPPAGVEGWPTEFVAQDGIEVNDLDNVTLNLGRKRLAGKYNGVSKGAEGKQIILNVDGTQNGLGDYVKYEPWLSGIGSGAIQNPQLNLLYLIKKDEKAEPEVLGWSLSGDTLRLWNTKTVSEEGDMPEYKPEKLFGAFVKMK